MNEPVSLQRLGIHVIRRIERARAIGRARRLCTRVRSAEIDIAFVPVDDRHVISRLYLSHEPIEPEEAIRRLASLPELVRVDLATLQACPPEAVGTFTIKLRFEPELA